MARHLLFCALLLSMASCVVSTLPEHRQKLLDFQESGPKRLNYERDVLSHNFTFVVGAHHSGTTLVNLLCCISPDATCLKETWVPEDEGSFMQTIYPGAVTMTEMFSYGFKDGAHITEQDPRATQENALKLFGVWSPFWDTTRRTCVEKSPPHLLKTRFLQALFTRDRTRFVVLLRHPMAVSRFMWSRGLGRSEKILQVNCGRDYIQHWLQLHDILEQDMQEGLDPKHVLFIQFEHLMGYGTPNPAAGQARMQRLLYRMYEFLGIRRPDEPLQFGGGPGGAPAGDKASASGRQLLNFHGKKSQLRIMWEDPLAWVQDFQSLVDEKSEHCVALPAEVDDKLKVWGYSMSHPTVVGKPHIQLGNLLWED